MSVFYKTRINNRDIDLDDLYVRREYFISNNLFEWGDQVVVSAPSRSTPVQVTGSNWKQITNSSFVRGGVKSDGTLWMWGENFGGATGIGFYTDSPTQLGSSKDWKYISTGYYTAAALKNDGTLWTWGYNNRGQLGQNSLISRSSPVQTVAGGNNWKFVSAGYEVMAGIKTDGTLWLWGANRDQFNNSPTFATGTIGDNSSIDRSSPVQTAAGGSNWKTVSVSRNDGDNSYCVAAIKTDGTLWGWGRNNSYGNIGRNDRVNRSSPVQVGTDTNWKLVSVGDSVVGAIKNDGTLWTWGNNFYGELGNNLGISLHRSSPVQVGSSSDWKYISIGYQSVLAIKNNGTLWAWGYNNDGQLGDGTNVNRSSPVQIGTDYNWVSVSASFSGIGIKY
jgi:alpha-tubulin suppressor-like RCC1 family protein